MIYYVNRNDIKKFEPYPIVGADKQPQGHAVKLKKERSNDVRYQEFKEVSHDCVSTVMTYFFFIITVL